MQKWSSIGDIFPMACCFQKPIVAQYKKTNTFPVKYIATELCLSYSKYAAGSTIMYYIYYLQTKFSIGTSRFKTTDMQSTDPTMMREGIYSRNLLQDQSLSGSTVYLVSNPTQPKCHFQSHFYTGIPR